ncbi:MAG TPA: hypothetical protein VFL91_14410 [Thermomicrobiales bacterium]|nr:hypothetical protein [Thermomicrobiales bacterium]
MGQKDFFIRLDEENRLRVRIAAERGTVAAFMVQDGRLYPVVRYDTSHDDAHRDILVASGHNVGKDWLPGWPFNAALQCAMRDLRANWPQYRDDFI